MTREQKLTIALLKEKIEKLSGKKVVFEMTEEQAKVAKLVEALEKLSGKKVVFEKISAQDQARKEDAAKHKEKIKKDWEAKKAKEKEEKEKKAKEAKDKKAEKKTVKEGTELEEAELEEGWFGSKSVDEVRKEYLQTIGLWASKGYRKPNQAQFDTIMQQAQADKFGGKLGVDKEKNIIYRPAASINWSAAAGHTFGGGA